MYDDVVFPHLHIAVHKLERVAFTLFGIPVYWYGVIIALGILAGVLAAVLNAKRLGVDTGQYWDFALYVVPICVVGARLYYVAFSWDLYRDNLLDIFAIREGGLAIYGAVIAAFLTAVVYTRIKRLNFWVFADVGIVGLPLGQAIGRWGNFINREAFGGYTDNLFAMQYLVGWEYKQVHPTFLYESAWNFALFALLMLFSRHKRFNGQIAAMYVLGYGLGRFWIEALRTDQLLFLGLPVSMLLAGVSAVCAAAFIVVGFVRNRRVKA